jgi:hypothetical protein
MPTIPGSQLQQPCFAHQLLTTARSIHTSAAGAAAGTKSLPALADPGPGAAGDSHQHQPATARQPAGPTKPEAPRLKLHNGTPSKPPPNLRFNRNDLSQPSPRLLRQLSPRPCPAPVTRAGRACRLLQAFLYMLMICSRAHSRQAAGAAALQSQQLRSSCQPLRQSTVNGARAALVAAPSRQTLQT